MSETSKWLQERVVPGVIEMLPEYSWMLNKWKPQTTKFDAGGDIYKRFQSKRNFSAAGVALEGNLPYKGSGQYDRFTVTKKKLSAQFAITGSLIRNGIGSINEAKDFLTSMQEDCRNGVVEAMDRMGWGDGSGRIGLVYSHAGGSADVVFYGDYDLVRFFHDGMKVFFTFAANGGANNAGYTVADGGVNYATNTVTFTGAVHNDCAVNDICYVGLQGADYSVNYDIFGMMAHVNDTTPATYQGKTRATTPFSRGTVVGNSGTAIPIDLNVSRRCIRIRQYKSKILLQEPMEIYADQGILDEYQKAHQANIRFTPSDPLGSKEQSLMIEGRTFEAFPTQVPYGRIFYLTPSSFELLEQTPLKFVDEDGLVLVRDAADANKEEFFATMVWEGAFYCKVPPANTVYKDISETTYAGL